VQYGCDDQLGVVIVQPGEGVAEADRDAVGEARRETKDPLLAAGAGQVTGVERADCGHGR